MSVAPGTNGRSRRRPRLTGLLLAAALAAVAVLFGGGVAAAHAYLRSSDPADGSSVPGLPARVSLDFNETIHDFEPVVVVTGPDGKNHATGEIRVVGNMVSTAVSTDGPAGSYAVAYRVVSADGHPVTGELHFTVTAPASSSPSGTSSSSSMSSPTGGVSTPTARSAGSSRSSTGSASSTGVASPTSSSARGASTTSPPSSAPAGTTPASTPDPGSSTPVDQAAGGPATSSGPDWWIWLAIAVAAVILIAAGVIALRRPHED